MAIPYELLVEEDIDRGYGTRSVSMPAGGTATGHLVGIHSFLDGVYNVQDFGAVGDGTSDDTTAIQAAVNAAAGSTVFFPPLAASGYYRLSNKITLATKTRVIGSGLAGQIRQTVAEKQCFYASGVDGLLFDNLALYGQGGYSNAWVSDLHYDRGIDLATCTRAVVRHCLFQNFALAGILATGGSRLLFEGNTIEGTHQYGVPLVSNDNHQYGICLLAAVPAGSDIRVIGNDVSYVTQGIDVTWFDRVVVALNNIHSVLGQHGMYVSGQGVTISGNHIIDCQYAGIKLYTVGRLITNVTITGNTILSSLTALNAAIEIGATAPDVQSKIIVVGNQLSGHAHGVCISDNTSRVLVAENQIESTQGGDGVLINGLANAEIEVSRNMIRDVARNGVFAINVVTGLRILDNKIENPAAGAPGADQCGVAINGTVDDIVVAGNRIVDAAGRLEHGIEITAATNLRIRDNYIRGANTYNMRADVAVTEYRGNDELGSILGVANLSFSEVVEFRVQSVSEAFVALWTKALDDNSVYWITAEVVAEDTATPARKWSFTSVVCFGRSGAGIATQEGSEYIPAGLSIKTAGTTADYAWSVSVNSVILQVRSAAVPTADVYNWRVKVRYTKV